MKITISLINNEEFANRVATEITSLFDSFINSCATIEQINLAKLLFTALANKETSTLNYILPVINKIINDMTDCQYTEAEMSADEIEEIRDLFACHAVVHLVYLE